MAENKPCISELFENDVLDMELVGKIAHNELDKQKGFPFSSVSANSIRALASEYIDSYTNDLGIIEAYAAVARWANARPLTTNKTSSQGV